MDDKIGAKDLPKDLQRLATKVIESEQDVEKTVGKKVQKKVTQGSHPPPVLHCLVLYAWTLHPSSMHAQRADEAP